MNDEPFNNQIYKPEISHEVGSLITFYGDDAEKYGVPAAVLLNAIEYWWLHHRNSTDPKTKKVNTLVDGKWYFRSILDLSVELRYNEKTIRRAKDALVEAELIETKSAYVPGTQTKTTFWLPLRVINTANEQNGNIDSDTESAYSGDHSDTESASLYIGGDFIDSDGKKRQKTKNEPSLVESLPTKENSLTTSLKGLAKPDTKSSLPGVVELSVKKEKVPLKRKSGAALGLVGRICSMLSKRANRLTEYSDKGRDLMEQIARLDTQKKRAADNIAWLLDNGYTKDRILKVAASSMNITRKVTDDSGVEHDLCGNLALYLTVTEDRRDWLVNIMDTWYRPSLAEAKAIAENYAKRDLDALDDDLDDETVD